MSIHKRFSDDVTADLVLIETPSQARARMKASVARAHRLAMQRETRVRLYGGARRPKQDMALWVVAVLGFVVILAVIFGSEPVAPIVAGW